MDFFNSLTLDLKMLVVGIVGAALLALFSGNHKSERRYVVVLAVLGAVGVYRFTHMPPEDPGARSVAETSVPLPKPVTVSPKKAPIVSTAAK